MATPLSAYLLNFFRLRSMMKKETIQAMTAPILGEKPAASPMATPAKEEWAKASPEEERRLQTAVDPTKGSKIPRKIAATRAIRLKL